MNTIQQLYQDEIRTIQLTLYDKNNTSFAPSGAFYQVVDSDGDVIMEEISATISENVVSGSINTTVTGTVGTYFIVWKLQKSGSTYYHKTMLNVVTLLPNI